MSEEEVQLELQSIQAIFSEEVNLESPRQIVVHCAAQIRLNLCLPPEYPRMAPSIELCAPSVGGEEKRRLLGALDKICAEHRGEPMLYSLIEQALEFFAERRSKEEEGPAETQSEPAEIADDGCGTSAFYSGLTIEDRKSKFQAHVAKLHSKDQIPALLSQLKSVGKIARATHNTYAWRILINPPTNEDGTQQRQIQQHDCDDDGENGAGSKLLRLVVQMNAQGVLVVVSRWYGGRHLGPDRFRHICNAAREALIPALLSQLKSVGKIARATHNTYAWRILINSPTNENVTQQRQIQLHDCDDDGENGAGSKLLRVLVQMDAQGVLVVVSRWYGGHKLGPDRFRHICNAAREALVSGGFVKDPTNS